MRFSAITAAAAAVAVGVQAASNSTGDVYVTEVVTEYTTFCPVATQFTQAGKTYTVTEPTTLTITHCPGGCTITKPVISTPTTPSSPQIPAITSSSSIITAPIYPTGSNSTNGTASITKPTLSASGPAGGSASVSGPAGTAATTSSSFTGAANNLAASGAGLAAFLGFAAYIL